MLRVPNARESRSPPNSSPAGGARPQAAKVAAPPHSCDEFAPSHSGRLQNEQHATDAVGGYHKLHSRRVGGPFRPTVAGWSGNGRPWARRSFLRGPIAQKKPAMRL